MKTFQTLYIYIVYLIPLLVVIGVNYWLLRKAMKVPAIGWKILALLLMLAGTGYSVYATIVGIRPEINDMKFPFSIIVVNAVLFAIIAIVITAGQPEKE